MKRCGHRHPTDGLISLSLAILVSVLTLLAMPATLVNAAPASGTTARAQRTLAPRADSTQHVTVIVLDMSNSMADNDPQGYRCSAANAYIDLSGPGDFVGVVGLNNVNNTTTPDGFPATVDWGLAPRELATVNDRETLKTAIQQKSDNCKPGSHTPTYDALNQALTMLSNSTQNGALSGSVILLTDGLPYPDTTPQMNAIQQQLVPQFKQHDWRVDTVALGKDTSFHSFLSDISDATSGLYYDDGKGVVPGVSPLNIMPFFLDIFRIRNGRAPGPDLPPVTLNGGTTRRNFTVGDYVTHLDIVVVKDSSSTQVSVLAPTGQRIPPAIAGAFVSTDPYYTIFSLDSPQKGEWELDVTGSGQFLMDSLKTSSLTLAITAPDAKTALLPLGEPFTLSAQLSDQGTVITGGQFSLFGSITFAGDTGGGSGYRQDVVLSDPSGSGTYSVQVTIPTTKPSGSYEITVRARQATEDVATKQSSVRMDLFPAALLLGPHGPTTTAVSANVTQWDTPLRILYSLPGASLFSGPPLNNLPAIPAAVVHGQVTLAGRPYTDAKVSGVATLAGTKKQIPVTFVNDGNGAFHLVFPSDAAGVYTLALTTEGAFKDSHGDLTHVTRTVNVTITPNTTAQRERAYLITALYLLILLLLLLTFRYALAQKPYGSINDEEFRRANRGLLARFLRPSVVSGRLMDLDTNPLFRFGSGGFPWDPSMRFRGRRIQVRQHGVWIPIDEWSGAEGANRVTTDSSDNPNDGDEDYSGYGADERPRRGGLLGGIFGGRRSPRGEYEDEPRRGRSRRHDNEYDEDDGVRVSRRSRRRNSEYDE